MGREKITMEKRKSDKRGVQRGKKGKRPRERERERRGGKKKLQMGLNDRRIKYPFLPF